MEMGTKSFLTRLRNYREINSESFAVSATEWIHSGDTHRPRAGTIPVSRPNVEVVDHIVSISRRALSWTYQ